MDNADNYVYTMGENSPDRLVIDMEQPASCDSSPNNTRLLNDQPRVNQTENMFSMANLLGGTHQPRLHQQEQPITNIPSFKHVFPSIHETFCDIVNAYDLPHPTNHSEVSRPVAVSNMATPTTDQTNTHHTTTLRPVEQKVAPTTYRKKKDAYDKMAAMDKPPYTYVGLIAMAIHSSEEKMLTLHGVREKLKTWFPFFNGAYTGWRESVRHTISSHQCFYKSKPEAGTRCHYWAINYANVQPHILVLRGRAVQSGSQYHYHLNEQVGVPPIPLPERESYTDKPGNIRLPPKPSFDSMLTNSTDNDFLCARTDDAASLAGDYGAIDSMRIPISIPTTKHNPQHQKRKAELPAFSETVNNEKSKRRKMAAVNPRQHPVTTALSTQTSKPDPTRCVPTNQSTTSTTPAFDANKPTTQQNNPVPQYSPYTTDMFTSGQHYISPYSAQHSLYGYQYQYWPYNNIDSSSHSQTNSIPYNAYTGYQTGFNAASQQQYSQDSVPAYSVWPYHTYPAFQDSLSLDGHSTYWQRQSGDSYSAPMNLCKTSDKHV